MLRPDSKFIAGSPVSDKYLGDNLIFIISLPRSGSTLLQRVLGGHDDVVTSSEPWIMLHPVYGRRDKGISTEYSADWAALGVNEFLEHYTDGPMSMTMGSCFCQYDLQQCHAKRRRYTFYRQDPTLRADY